MRIAHFSDIHVTHSPFREGGIHGKRLVGTFNRVLGGRGRHFAAVDQRIKALLADIDGQDVQHAICTGDVTQMSYPSEFEAVAAIFGEKRLSNPSFFTVLPGNHDRYTTKAAEHQFFEEHFGALCEDGTFPFLKRIGPSTQFIGLDVARACSLLDSSGICGVSQLAALEKQLDNVDREKDLLVVGLHYGLLTVDGIPDKPRHGLRDAPALLEALLRPGRGADVVLHGHLHQAYSHYVALEDGAPKKVASKEGLLEICAGSATDLHKSCTYHILEISEDQGAVQIETRAFQDGTYQAIKEEILPLARSSMT
ncbi:MAG: metallophosphoesterase [Deltaproteobacteria bacterium]|nr:metallophosphoesterase [Deltaproteobacteria bacterium]